jgi:hypothetical protein
MIFVVVIVTILTLQKHKNIKPLCKSFYKQIYSKCFFIALWLYTPWICILFYRDRKEEFCKKKKGENSLLMLLFFFWQSTSKAKWKKKKSIYKQKYPNLELIFHFIANEKIGIFCLLKCFYYVLLLTRNRRKKYFNIPL